MTAQNLDGWSTEALENATQHILANIDAQAAEIVGQYIYRLENGVRTWHISIRALEDQVRRFNAFTPPSVAP